MVLNSLFSKLNPEEHFWKWFTKLSDEYFYHLNDRQEKLFNNLTKELEKVNKDMMTRLQTRIISNGGN